MVPCFNAEKTIGKCIDACLDQDYPNVEVVVVDDGSSDSSVEILRRYGNIQVISQPQKGPAKARNLGWRSSSGEIICFTDSDCIPNSNWVSRIVVSYKDANVGGVGGGYDIANPESWLARCIHEEIRERHLRMHDEVDYLGSFNVSYARRVLDEVGGFDEGFKKASAEDNDISYRVRKLGHTLLFDANNCVAHHYVEHFWSYMRKQFWRGYWRISLYKRHGDMLGGDDYADLFDFLQLPLSLAAGIAWAFSCIKGHFIALAIALTIIVLSLQIPVTLSMVRRTGDVRILPFALIVTTRAFFRGLGMIRGLISSSPSEILALIRAFFGLFSRRKQSGV